MAVKGNVSLAKKNARAAAYLLSGQKECRRQSRHLSDVILKVKVEGKEADLLIY